MSSTLPHYQGPASLPSDYALLSRYAGHPDGEQHDRVEPDDELMENEHGPERPSSTSILRRASLPAPRRNSFVGYVHHFPNVPVPGPIPTENTLLLNPPVPRMDEPMERMSDDGGKTLVFLGELRILTRYALPVFA